MGAEMPLAAEGPCRQEREHRRDDDVVTILPEENHVRERRSWREVRPVAAAPTARGSPREAEPGEHGGRQSERPERRCLSREGENDEQEEPGEDRPLRRGASAARDEGDAAYRRRAYQAAGGRKWSPRARASGATRASRRGAPRGGIRPRRTRDRTCSRASPGRARASAAGGRRFSRRP